MKFRRTSERKIHATIDSTPLIDVVFQLLIFFMLTSSFVVHTSVPVELSEAEGASELDNKEMSITLVYGTGGPEDGGEVYINEVPITNWTQLTRSMAELRDTDPEALVLIRPDARVPTERLVKVLGFANSVGIKHYGIAAIQPSETP
ncbi:MAG TPA: biopolymer transporter ExbD [Candidatus Hydrogenedentes bacterium]|mgnify:FL=1|jgi:biopolymer transport protein ExbD|nr:biopolymer transporter ExbD [Candidatus Hydrogenedentota bacterium]HOH30970.1 biopolymer transporter ExbD [Candidatus Hydrogenedentota bacterium]